jgi:hypothetical protein
MLSFLFWNTAKGAGGAHFTSKCLSGVEDCSSSTPQMQYLRSVPICQSVRQSSATFGAAAGKDFPTILGGHSLAEAVYFLTMKLFGLIGTFGCHELHLRIVILLNKPGTDTRP